MSPHPFFSLDHLRIAQEVRTWAETYLMQPDERINRPYGKEQTVCPFVKASVENDCFYMVFHDEVNGHDPEAIAEVALHYVEPFRKMRPRKGKERIKKALLIIFPHIEEEDYESLDICHEVIKPTIVANSLMVGQFHPRCTTIARHNPAWNGVSVSPYPLLAMRHMAIHDVLFLGADREWFLKYNLIFGHRFNKPDELDEHDKPLIKYYKEARRQFLDT